MRPVARLKAELASGGVRYLRGDFDTGADLTLVPAELMGVLGINDKDCVPIPIGPLGRPKEMGRLAFLSVRLDNPGFSMPVAFVNRHDILFGRPGLMDRYRIESDPSAAVTCFSWTGISNSTGDWTTSYRQYKREMLKQPMTWSGWWKAGRHTDLQGRLVLHAVKGGAVYRGACL